MNLSSAPDGVLLHEIGKGAGRHNGDLLLAADDTVRLDTPSKCDRRRNIAKYGAVAAAVAAGSSRADRGRMLVGGVHEQAHNAIAVLACLLRSMPPK